MKTLFLFLAALPLAMSATMPMSGYGQPQQPDYGGSDSYDKEPDYGKSSYGESDYGKKPYEKCTYYDETQYQEHCEDYEERICTTNHKEKCSDVKDENCRGVVSSKQMRKCFDVTELKCSLKEDVEMETVQMPVTVQKCRKVPG